jgi:hypothetical protein
MTGPQDWRWSLAALAVLGLCGAALPVLLLWAQLPEPLAVHWSVDFRPDGAMAKRSVLLVNGALIGVALLASLVGAAQAYVRGRATRLMLLTIVGGIATTTSATFVTRNLGKAAWTDAEPLTIGLLVVQIALPAAAAALAYYVGLRRWAHLRAPDNASSAALPLAASARAFWSGGASNRWLLAIGAALLGQALLLFWLLPRVPSMPVWVALHAVVLVVLEWFSFIRVTIDGRGVAIRYGHLGLWTRRVPLREIARARALTLDAMEHGGWGYRGGLRLFGKASIVVRSGSAIELTLRDDKRLFVTVDDAATAAELLNGLLARERASSAEPVLSPVR